MVPSRDKSEREDPKGVPLVLVCCASRWHKDVQ